MKNCLQTFNYFAGGLIFMIGMKLTVFRMLDLDQAPRNQLTLDQNLANTYQQSGNKI